jgi:hypothetical protein
MSEKAVVWTVAVALATMLLAFAWHGYPAPNTDAPSFLVSAINSALGRGLVNPYYAQIAFADPTGAQRHVYYPPAFPLVVRALLPAPTARGAFLAVAMLRAASLLLSALLLLRVAGGRRPPGRAMTALVALALCALATNWLPTIGRPEALATLFVILAALAALRLRGWALAVVFGVLLGLTAGAQPLGGFELGLLMCLWLAAGQPPAQAAPQFAAVVLAGLVVFAAVLACSPHGLAETVLGMVRAYPHTPWASPPGEGWWKPWLTFPRSTFYGPFFLLAAGCGAHLLARRDGPRAPLLMGTAALGLVVAVYHGSLTHHSLRNYNALLLSPVAAAVIVAWAARQAGGARARWAWAACLAVTGAAAAGFFGHLASFPWYLRHAQGLDQARARWAAAPIRAGAHVSMVGNLWALDERYDRLHITPATDVSMPAHVHEVLLLGQRPGRAEPPPVTGFDLVLDAFNRELARPGWHRAFVREDYSFAVYVKKAR